MSTFWGPDFGDLERTDPEIASVVLGELARVRGGLQLIASENLTSPAVLAALGSTLTNKYAEGYPGRRYYGGCAEVDRAESIGIARAMALFQAEHANLQPHSGASANLAAYAALVQPGDTVLAMDLPHGGHLTHGSKVNFSGRWYGTVGYHVDQETERIDYDEVRDLALAHRPKMIICGATAYPRLIDFAVFREIADEVDAYLLVDAAHFIGLVAGRAVPSPVPYADVVTATTHKVLRGPRGGMILCRRELADRIDKAVFPFTQGGPLMHVIAAKAVALHEAAQPDYQRYAHQVVANARALAQGLAAQGMRPAREGMRPARGVLLDEDALYQALVDRRIGGAGLDVRIHEPPEDNRFEALSNVVLTPHIAGSTEEAQAVSAEMVVASVLQAARGERPHGLINEEVWDRRRA